MNKKEIYDKILKRNFPEEGAILLEFLQLYLDRIEFVKDHIGLRDFLFICEKGVHDYEARIFSCIDLPVVPRDTYHNFTMVENFMETDVDTILLNLENFFLSTERTLYVNIVFKESAIEQTDMFRLRDGLKEKTYADSLEAIAKLRKFPRWYQAKFPEEIEIEVMLEERLELYDEYLGEKLKREVLLKIDEALANCDEKTFLELSNRFSSLFD